MNPWGKKPQGEGKGNLTVFRTIKRNCVGAGKHLFPNSFWHMLWEILFVSEISVLYRSMMRYFSRWKLRINRLYPLEAPEGRCWEQVRRRRGLQGDLASQGSRVGGGGLGGVKPQTRCRWDHQPVPSALTPGKGLRLSRRCQQLGSQPPGVFADEQPVLFWRETWVVVHTLSLCVSGTRDFLGSRDD